MSVLRPSPALLVRADTTIGDCVRKMRDEKVGSLLIVPSLIPGERAELMGIFTERDLLKWIDELQHGNGWHQAVGVLMSQPVITLPFDQLDHAGELMIQKGIRHLPVVKDGRLLGVVSMRDLYRQLMEETSLPSRRWKSVSMGILLDPARGMSPLDEASYELLRLLKVKVERLAVAAIPVRGPDLDSIGMDIDRQDPDHWPDLLKRINKSEGLPRAFILFTRALHSPSAIAVLERLKDADEVRDLRETRESDGADGRAG